MVKRIVIFSLIESQNFHSSWVIGLRIFCYWAKILANINGSISK